MAARILRLVVPLVLSVCFAVPALASGLGVSPARLNFEVASGGVSEETLNVINNSGEESEFRVYAEDMEDWFIISPNEFTLTAEQQEEVNIKVTPPTDVSGQHELSVCVVSISPENGLRVGVGVKVPTTVLVTSTPTEVGHIAGLSGGTEPKSQSAPIYFILIVGVIFVLLISIIITWRKLRSA